jgi:hypothetical protein
MNRSAVRLMILFILFLPFSLRGFGDSHAAPPRARLITVVREAYNAATGNLTSGAGVGVYEHSTQQGDGRTMTIRVKADAKIWFDKDKYHISLKYNENAGPVRSTTIIYDGDMLIKTDVSVAPGSKKLYTRTELFPVANAQSPPYMAGFPFNPSKLPDAAFILGRKLDQITDKIEITEQPTGGYLATCPYDNDRMEVHFLPQYGYNASSLRIYNKGKDRAVAERQTIWGQEKGVWFVKSITRTIYPPALPASKDVLVYHQFQPNIAVPKELFRVASLQISENSSIIDRRPGSEHRVYRAKPLGETSGADVDKMADYIKTLPPRHQGAQHPSSSSQLWLLIGGTALAVVGAAFLWRRWKTAGRPPAASA